ncbi:MAG: DUF2975 domain-containing protein [Prevotella sp.]
MNKRITAICVAITAVAIIHVALTLYLMGQSFGMGYSTAQDCVEHGEQMTASASAVALIPKQLTDESAVNMIDCHTGKSVQAWPLQVVVASKGNTWADHPAIILSLSFLTLVGGIMALMGMVRFVRCLYRREVFSWHTVKFLRRSGWGMLVCGGSATILALLQCYSAYQTFDPEHYRVNFSEHVETGYIIFSLFLLLMAEAFAQGLRLQEEQELTI